MILGKLWKHTTQCSESHSLTMSREHCVNVTFFLSLNNGKSGVRYLEISVGIDSNCTIPLSKLKCCHGFFSNDEGLILQEVNDSCLQNISELVIFKFVSLYLGMDGETAGEFAHFN